MCKKKKKIKINLFKTVYFSKITILPLPFLYLPKVFLEKKRRPHILDLNFCFRSRVGLVWVWVLMRMMHGWEHGLSARVHTKAYGQGKFMDAIVGPRACANAGPTCQSCLGALLVVVHVRPTWPWVHALSPAPHQCPSHPCAHIMPANTYPTQTQVFL